MTGPYFEPDDDDLAPVDDLDDTAARIDPDDVTTETAFGRLSRREFARRGRVGGLRRAAGMTPQERSEAASRAAKAKWAKVNAEREAAGLPLTKPVAPLMSATELEPWLEEIDRRWPDRVWNGYEERRREAMILARLAAAESLREYDKRQQERQKGRADG